MRKYLCIIMAAILFFNCVGKKEPASENMEMENTLSVKLYIELHYFSNGDAAIWQYCLDKAGISSPNSLREISERINEEERNLISYILIENGENITSLEGAELFPALDILIIRNSKIKNLKGFQESSFNIEALSISSEVLEDVSDIVLFKNLIGLSFEHSNMLEHIPDISHLKDLYAFSLRGCANINFNDIAKKLPSGIEHIYLSNTRIESLNDVADLFNKCKQIDLGSNLIREIDIDMDFGTLTYLYLGANPVADYYYIWGEPVTEEFPGSVISKNGVRIAFGSYEDGMW